MTSADSFGRRLRALRRQQGITQTELAGDELSTSYVSLLESGKRRPTVEIALKLAARLNVAPEVLLNSGEPESAPAPSGHMTAERELLLARGELALAEGGTETARDLFAQALRSSGGTPPPMALRGLALANERLGRLEEAVSLYGEALSKRYDDWDVRLDTALSLAGCLADLGRAEESMDRLEEAARNLADHGLDGSPLAVAAAAGLVRQCLDRGLSERAAELVGTWAPVVTGLARRGRRVESYLAAASMAETSGDAHAAAVLTRRALAAHAGDRDTGYLARWTIAAALAHERCTTPAPTPDDLAAALAALARDPGTIAARWRLDYAEQQVRAGQPQAALGEVEQVMSEWTGRGALLEERARLICGRAHWGAGATGHAHKELDRAAAALASFGAVRLSAEAYLELARLTEDAGDTATALSAYRTAAELGLNAGPTIPR
ncbi:helix-turn-helix domain-containing protein [Actinomadura macrotermitis]|uniref:helix-turn-helix domain-containing protein n=1 Tax=Actinomadura macrotermitis TaxID=2585200 RepID=UPI001886845E|nr:helix-turn-helix transcriptional regulator [Actinomadura macrotermitis]